MSYNINKKDSSDKAKKCYQKTGMKVTNNIRKTRAELRVPRR